MLSNFEKGFKMLVEADNMQNGGSRTRKTNEAICLMYSDDPETTEAIVPNHWERNRALQSPFAVRYLLGDE